jgi:serine/threonine protein kinase
MAFKLKALWKFLGPGPGSRERARARAASASTPSTPSTDVTPNAGTHGTPSLPQRFGRYRVESEIGRGAMGAVYKGLDPSTGDIVAIKTISLSREFRPDEMAEARLRFFRESETASLLVHPDIVAIKSAGDQGEVAYIAMEYIDGRDLAWYAHPGRLLPVADLLRIVARIAEALAFAHTQGVVHRDIKPANIMVDIARDVVKVTDFGVARIADSSRTRSGVVLGTPAFMSPEQMAGGQVDGRTDIYSLGVVLFNLLTGRLPHRAASMSELMFQIANHAPPDVRELRPDLPETLADVVTLALEKRPEVRYADGYEFAADLRAVAGTLDAPPVDATPISEQADGR